jgi:hypothetical protein
LGRKLKIAKWLAEISDFDFQTVMTPSKDMHVSDCLSTHHQLTTMDKIEINIVKPSEFAFLQKSDPVLNELFDYHTIDRWPNFQNEDIKEYSRLRNKLTFGEHGELGISKNGFKAIPPKTMYKELLEEYHDNTGHPGIYQTLMEIEQKYYFQSMRDIVTSHIRSCKECQLIKPVNNPLNAPLGHVKAPSQLFERYSIDLIGPLPLTDNQGRKAAVVIRWGIEFLILCGSAPLEPHFIRHRDSVALFNSRFFSTAPLEPHLIHYCEPVPKKNTLHLLVVELNTVSRWRTPRAGGENKN